MYKLFETVQLMGGYSKINDWSKVGKPLDLPHMTNAGYILRSKYDSFILPSEQLLLDEFPIKRWHITQEDTPANERHNWILSKRESQEREMKQKQQTIEEKI